MTRDVRRVEEGTGKVRQSDESRVNIFALGSDASSSGKMRRRVKTVSSALVVALIALFEGKK